MHALVLTNRFHALIHRSEIHYSSQQFLHSDQIQLNAFGIYPLSPRNRLIEFFGLTRHAVIHGCMAVF